MTIAVVIFIIILALAFEFINGFHDTANAVATSVATRSLTPFQAIVLAAICNVLGALVSTNVARNGNSCCCSTFRRNNMELDNLVVWHSI